MAAAGVEPLSHPISVGDGRQTRRGAVIDVANHGKIVGRIVGKPLSDQLRAVQQARICAEGLVAKKNHVAAPAT